MSVAVLVDKVEVVQKKIKPPISKIYIKRSLEKETRQESLKFKGQKFQNERTKVMNERKLSKRKHQEKLPEPKEVSVQGEGAQMPSEPAAQ